MIKVCIFGAGAIGGYIAACLSKTDTKLSLIARGLHKEAIKKKGLTFIKDGKTEVHFNMNVDNKTLKFKLKNTRNLDRKSLNIIRKQEISSIIS